MLALHLAAGAGGVSDPVGIIVIGVVFVVVLLLAVWLKSRK